MTHEGGGSREVLAGFHLAWVRAADLPVGEAWLSPREREVLGGLKLPKRRLDWLLGRWAAKRAVAASTGTAIQSGSAAVIEILAAEGGRPLAAGVAISISHAGGVGFAAAVTEGRQVGCDVEVVEPRSEAFVSDYLTQRERTAVAPVEGDDRTLLANLIWSAKESALKVLGEGLRMDTRSVEVDFDYSDLPGSSGDGRRGAPTGWRRLGVSGPRGGRFVGFWRARDDLVWTVVTGS